jgi:acetyl esterase
MALDPHIAALLNRMNTQEPPPQLPTVAEMRVGVRQLLAMVNADRALPDGIEVREISLGRDPVIGARLYTPARTGQGTLPLLVFFHGGGWVVGDLETHDVFCRVVADMIGCHVASIDYRLAPEHRFPAGLDDAYAAVEALVGRAEEYGVNRDRIAVCGDSAGGTLATVVARLARDRQGPAICTQILICPSTDLGGVYPSRIALSEGYMISESEIIWFRDQYLPADVTVADDRVSPSHATDLSRLPPAIVVTAGFDPLADEGQAYAGQLEEAGNNVTRLHFPALIHGFNLLDALSPGAAEAVARLCRETRALLA